MTGLRLFLVLCFICSFLLTASGHSIFQRRNGADESLSSFKLTRISQQSGQNGTKIQLHFQGTSLPRVILMDDYGTNAEDLEMQDNGVAEFYINSSPATIMLLHPRGYQNLVISRTEESPEEENVHDAELFVQGGKDIVFQRGNDINVNITLRINNPTSVSNNSVTFSTVMKSETKEQTVDEYKSKDDQSPFVVLDHGSSRSEKYAQLFANTSSNEFEGLLVLSVLIKRKCSNGCLLRFLKISEDVPVYRADHTHPFPEHFVGFKKGCGSNSSQVVCDRHDGRPCILRCEFVGDRPSAVQFERVDESDGQSRRMHELSLTNNGYRAIGFAQFKKVEASDEGTYQCKSSSGSEEATHTINLVVT